MNKSYNYAHRGQWIFAILIVCILATIYAAQVRMMTLFFACIVISLIISLGLLILLLQSDKALAENEQELLRLQQRETARLQNEQQTTDDSSQKAVTLNSSELLSRIIADTGTPSNNATAYTEKVLQNIAKELNIVQGLIFVLNEADHLFHISGEYAYYSEEQPRSFPLGETLSGQVAKNQMLLNVKELPEGYVTILSGLGKSNPRHLVIAPIVHNSESIGIIELASFKPFSENEELLIRQIGESMANLLNNLRK